MGQFSWLDCQNNKKQILDDYPKTCYVLVPEEFHQEYGKHIAEPYYEGYGDFGEYDIYDLVALWNREHIRKHPEVFGKYVWYETFASDTDNKSIPEKLATVLSYDATIGGERPTELRDIGIDLHFNERDRILYGIKVTYNRRLKYSDCPLSEDDPNQGWSRY